MKTMLRQEALFTIPEIPAHRLERARTLIMQIRDRVRWSRATSSHVNVSIDKSNLIVLDDMIDILEDKIANG